MSINNLTTLIIVPPGPTTPCRGGFLKGGPDIPQQFLPQPTQPVCRGIFAHEEGQGPRACPHHQVVPPLQCGGVPAIEGGHCSAPGIPAHHQLEHGTVTEYHGAEGQGVGAHGAEHDAPRGGGENGPPRTQGIGRGPRLCGNYQAIRQHRGQGLPIHKGTDLGHGWGPPPLYQALIQNNVCGLWERGGGRRSAASPCLLIPVHLHLEAHAHAHARCAQL